MHRTAKEIFSAIQARPYRVTVEPCVRAENCFYKGTELLTRLGTLGYAVRGRVAETCWDPAVFPASLVALYPKDVLCTHFFPEVEIDGAWRIVDPSFHPAMARLGARIGSFDGTPTPCFPVVKLYDLDESVAYQNQWNDAAYVAAYFARCGTFLRALNRWLDDVDKGDPLCA